MHTGEKPYSCQFCNLKFTQKGNRDSHVEKYHREYIIWYIFQTIINIFLNLSCIAVKSGALWILFWQKMLKFKDIFVCTLVKSLIVVPFLIKKEILNFIVIFIILLQNEYEAIRIDSKKYACPICSIVMRSPSVVRDHVRIHTGERPFGCALCDLSFRRKEDLTRHMKTHWK